MYLMEKLVEQNPHRGVFLKIHFKGKKGFAVWYFISLKLCSKHIFGEGSLVQFTVNLHSYAFPIGGEFDRFNLVNYQLNNWLTYASIALMVEQLTSEVSGCIQ